MAKGMDAYRTISEVAKWLGTQSHVLRYWESKFDAVQPMKSTGGRRYYRPDDMQLLGGIKHLLHTDGMTIKGVQQMMADKGPAHIAALSPVLDLPEKKSSRRKKTPARDLSGQTRMDNVISFTIDPLPLFKQKPPAQQPSLFPDMDTQAPLEKLSLTAEFTARPSNDVMTEAPMLNLFDDDPLPEPKAEVRMLLPKIPAMSAFRADAGVISGLVNLDRSERARILKRALTQVGSSKGA